MACEDRYAEAFDYAVWWSCQALEVGYDNSGGAANAFVTDTTAAWTSAPRIEVGAAIYNSTTSTYGVITAVAPTILQTSGVTWSNGDEYQIANMTGAERVTIENFLRVAASDINEARRSVGACDCSLASDSETYLAKLNMIDAALYHNCPCGRPDLSEAQRTAYLQWMTEQLNNIRTSATELCSGYTGSNYPYIGTAQMALTNWRAAEIILDTIRRTP